MSILDSFTHATSSNATSAQSSNARGANDIPPPRSDASVNAPPPQQHQRVIDFVREAPNARYTFDSRLNREQPDCELCRIDRNGSKQCVRLAMHSASLFKSMQGLGFYCMLPAEPHRTDMECNRLPKIG